jgi:hypothetical protein
MKNALKTFGKSLGAIVYSTFAAYLIWLLFHFLIPHSMMLGWGWMIVIYFILYTTVVGLITVLPMLLLYPIRFIQDEKLGLKFLIVIIFGFFGFSSIRENWTLDMDYTARTIVIGIENTLIIGTIYISAIAYVFMSPEYGD